MPCDEMRKIKEWASDEAQPGNLRKAKILDNISTRMVIRKCWFWKLIMGGFLMMRLLRQLLLKSITIRKAVTDRNERIKAQQNYKRWATYFEAGGTIR